MDNSSVSVSQMLGLSVVDDHNNQNISFEDGTALGTKRLHLDSESSVETELNSLSGYVIGKRIKTEIIEEASEDMMRRNSCDELGDDNTIMLNSTASESISSSAEEMTFPTEDESVDEDANVLIQHMDIKEPLSFLKKALEENHGINLEGYEFYLQDSTPSYCGYQCICNSLPIPEDTILQYAIIPCESIVMLAGHKNLVEQCVQGCGTVQVNLQLKVENDGTKKINIVDVLKPSDSYLLASGNMAFSPDTPEEPSQPPVVEEEEDDDETDKNPIRWVIDNNFKANQLRLQIPQDPMEWEVSHVRHWLLWAVRQFNLTGIKLADWKITGAYLCNLSLEAFKERVPYDPNDIFWTHLELLRRCQFVAVMQNPDDVAVVKEVVNKSSEGVDKNIMRVKERKPVSTKPATTVLVDHANSQNAWGNRTGHNGQIQLWQFLLDLLTDKNHRECIQWMGAEGEFKLIEPEAVARLWGLRKNKPSMNYEKLSRALRYYYDGDMIAKVHGKRFVYKFVCDMKQLLGYSAFQLNRLVIEAEMRAQNCANDPIQHSIFGSHQFNDMC